MSTSDLSARFPKARYFKFKRRVSLSIMDELRNDPMLTNVIQSKRTEYLDQPGDALDHLIGNIPKDAPDRIVFAWFAIALLEPKAVTMPEFFKFTNNLFWLFSETRFESREPFPGRRVWNILDIERRPVVYQFMFYDNLNRVEYAHIALVRNYDSEKKVMTVIVNHVLA